MRLIQHDYEIEYYLAVVNLVMKIVYWDTQQITQCLLHMIAFDNHFTLWYTVLNMIWYNKCYGQIALNKSSITSLKKGNIWKPLESKCEKSVLPAKFKNPHKPLSMPEKEKFLVSSKLKQTPHDFI